LPLVKYNNCDVLRSLEKRQHWTVGEAGGRPMGRQLSCYSTMNEGTCWS